MALNAISEALLQRMMTMTPGDISVLEAGLAQSEAHPGVKMTTSPGSDNDKLWSEIAKLGWIIVENDELIPDPSGDPIIFRVARITPQGRQPIAALLDASLNQRRSKGRAGQPAGEPTNPPPWLASGLSDKFAARLCEQISLEGGDAFDLSFMLARVALLAMQTCVQASNQPEAAGRMGLATKQRLAQIGEIRFRGVPISNLRTKRSAEPYSEEKTAKITAVHNQNCPQFVAELVKQVQDGGGKPNDLLSTIAFVVAVCIRSTIRPEDRDAMVDNVFDLVRKMVAAA